MLQRTLRRFARPSRSATVGALTYTPMEIFDQVQSGTNVSHLTTRNFIMRHFTNELVDRGLGEARLQSMDARSLVDLLRSLMFQHYVAVPFSVFTMDLEFTGLPGEVEGPPSIIELALYAPDTDKSFSTLVRPLPGAQMNPAVEQLTGIKPAELQTAPPFDAAWRSAVSFMKENSADGESFERTLVLSHGAKLADISMITEHCSHYGMALPSNIKFADTYNTVKDLHRRRPVTKEKLPPSWNLSELGLWLQLDVPSNMHRALPDAKLTWDVLWNTLDRYGDGALTPRQQLVARYFPSDGEARIHRLDSGTPAPAPASGKATAPATAASAAAATLGGASASAASASTSDGVATGNGDEFFDMGEDDEDDEF